MKVAFRADASIEIGTGHVMRCLTLAEALRDQGAECQFICSAEDGNMLQAIREKGFKASGVEPFMNWRIDAEQTQADLAESRVNWIIVDHYALDSRWEQALKAHCHKLMVIDDLADRTHDCDLLLDQNLGRLKSDYEKLVPAACQLLIGPKYALLRPEFAAWRDYSLKRRAVDTELKQLLISMGGTDYSNSTSQILQALKQVPLPTNCHITVVMGASSPWIQQATALAETMPWSTEVKVNVGNMAELMANSDLSIGAAGSTSWERCCLGLPSIQFVLANNQRLIANALHLANAAISVDMGSFNAAASALCASSKLANKLNSLTKATQTISNGTGVLQVRSTLCD